MLKNGDKVRIKDCKYFPVIVGLEGVIYNQFEYNGKTFYEIRATNRGGYIAKRKVFKWVEGNHTSRLETELEVMEL